MAELRSGEYGITEAGRRNIARRQQRKDPEVRKKERQDKAFIRQGRDSMANNLTLFISPIYKSK